MPKIIPIREQKKQVEKIKVAKSKLRNKSCEIEVQKSKLRKESEISQISKVEIEPNIKLKGE